MIKIIIITLILLITLGLALSWIVAGKLIAPVNKHIGEPHKPLKATTIVIDETLHGWETTVENPKGVIILCHGIRGSRLSMIRRAKMLQKRGYASLLIDLQAHGETKGKHVTVGYLEKDNVVSAVAYAKRKYPSLPLGVLGISLGGASTLLASPLDVDGIVLESVYSTLHRAVHNRVEKRLGVLGWIPAELLLMQVSLRLGFSKDDLRPIDYIDKVDAPLLVISGTEDYHTTKSETEELFESAQDPKELWLVEGASHEDFMKFTAQEYSERIIEFFDGMGEK